MIKHAANWNGNDVTLCGLAHEAADDPCTGETEPVATSKPGEYVTCPECKRVIDHCKSGFGARYRATPA